MKKIVLLSFFAMCLPMLMLAQSHDDLYYVPTKENKAEKEQATRSRQQEQYTSTPQTVEKEVTTIYTNPGTTVVIQDRKGNKQDITDMDVDAYNRRYNATTSDFEMENDTIVIKPKGNYALEGEWIGGFDGSQSDYEYAERIVRFRNPRYAIHISSPYYWDVVYGFNSWDWNVYTDGWYAYAFPTFSNRLWWDWRYGSFGFTWGWNSWYPGYYGGWYHPGYYGGWYGGYWGHHHHHHHYWGHHNHWGGGWHRPYYAGRNYTNRVSTGPRVSSRPTNTGRQSVGTSRTSSRQSIATVGSSRRTNTANTRVVGTRPSSSSSTRQSSSVRSTGSTRSTESSRGTYTRPSSSSSYQGTGTRNSSRSSSVGSSSSTRSSSSGSSVRGSSSSSSRSSSTYSRGSSSSPSRSSSSSRSSSYSPSNNSRSSSSSRSSSYSSGSSSRSSSSYSSGGGSSRSSGSFSGGGSSRSSGGGGSSRSSGGRR